MRRFVIIAAAALTAAAVCKAATVKYSGGDVTYAETTPCGEIEIDFKRCMANELYTFSSVRLNGKELNHTESDNIGPFGLDGRGWSGGNHLNDGRRSAYTEKVTIMLDNELIERDTTLTGDILVIYVRNCLLDPADSKNRFATENIGYVVSGNSIDVTARHDFLNRTPMTVERYYGMQSMFLNEKEILTPGGKYRTWTAVTPANTGHELSFTKAEAPNFCTFIERSDNGYQAAYMTCEGIGDRHLVRDDDIVFIGNSWTKNYHKIIGLQPVKYGDSTYWRGIYSWFDAPVSDNCRPGEECPTIDYIAYELGRPCIFHLGPDGTMTIRPLK